MWLPWKQLWISISFFVCLNSHEKIKLTSNEQFYRHDQPVRPAKGKKETFKDLGNQGRKKFTWKSIFLVPFYARNTKPMSILPIKMPLHLKNQML
jgi:hypothetical protein